MNFKYNKVKKVGYVMSFVVVLKLWIKKGIFFVLFSGILCYLFDGWL